jgi:hypothetical protein
MVHVYVHWNRMASIEGDLKGGRISGLPVTTECEQYVCQFRRVEDILDVPEFIEQQA